MQILLSRFDRPYGFATQVDVITRWLATNDEPVQVLTQSHSEEFFPVSSTHIKTDPKPWTLIDPAKPTLTSGYPASTWAYRAGIENYTVLLSTLPWGLYPKYEQKWLGQLSLYVQDQSTLFWRMLRSLVLLPYRKIRRALLRRRDRKAIEAANEILIHDSRLINPIEDLYDRTPELITPVCSVSRGGTSEPGNYLVAKGPLEPARNMHRIIDAFYYFINRLGTMRNTDWDSQHPLWMWESGDFELHIYGEGSGTDYLRQYAENHGLGDQIIFNSWIEPNEMDQEIETALGTISIPLTADESLLSYRSLMLGTPAIYSRRHTGIDSLIEDSSLTNPVGMTDTDEISQAMLDATKRPKSQRTPIDSLINALDPEHSIEYLRDII